MDSDHHLSDPQASPKFNFNSINISNTYNTPGPVPKPADQEAAKEAEAEPEDEPEELQPQYLDLAPYEPFIAVISVHEDYTEIQIGLDLIARDPKPPKCDDCHSLRKDGNHPVVYECFECIPPKIRPLCKKCAEKELSDLFKEEYFHKPDHERVRKWAPTWHYNLLQASKVPMVSGEMEEWAQEALTDDIRAFTFSSQEFYEDRTIRFFMPAPQGLCRVTVQIQVEPVQSKRREAHWKDEAKGWLESHVKGLNLLGMKEIFGKIGVSAHAFDLSTAPITPRNHVAKDPPREPKKDEKTTSNSVSLRRGDDFNKTRTLEVYVHTGFQQSGVEITLQDEYLESEEFHDSPFRWTVQGIKVVQLTQRVPSFASQAQAELYRRKRLKDKEEEHERRQQEWEARTHEWKEESDKRQEEYQKKLSEQQEKREQERRQIAVEQEEQRQALANEQEERRKQRQQEDEERRKQKRQEEEEQRKQRRQEDEDRRERRRQAAEDEQEERRRQKKREDDERRKRRQQEDEERRQTQRPKQQQEQYDYDRDRYDYEPERRGRDRERPTYLQQPRHDSRPTSMPAKQEYDKPAGLNIRYDNKGAYGAEHRANSSRRNDRPTYSHSQSYQDTYADTRRHDSPRDRYSREERLPPPNAYNSSSHYVSRDHAGRSVSPNWRAGTAGTPPLTRWTSISSAHSPSSGGSSPRRYSTASPPIHDPARLSVSDARRPSSTNRYSTSSISPARRQSAAYGASPSPPRRPSSAYRPAGNSPSPARRTSTTYRPSGLAMSPGRRPSPSYRPR